MIDKVMAKDFKGLSFNAPLKQFNLLTGDNGTGKSAITQALMLSIFGYMPQDQDKKPGTIHTNYSADGKVFSVGFEMSGTELARTYKPSGCQVFYNKKKIKAGEVSRAILEAGDPKVFALKAFMELSDTAKIDFILEYYPPAEDLTKLNQDIDTVAGNVSTLQAGIRERQKLIETLADERSALPALSGTLPEIQAAIEDKEKQAEALRAQLQEIEALEREAAAAEKAVIKEREKAAKIPSGTVVTAPVPEENWTDSIISDLREIMAIMEDAGCRACAARFGIKMKIKKYLPSGKEAVNG